MAAAKRRITYADIGGKDLQTSKLYLVSKKILL